MPNDVSSNFELEYKVNNRRSELFGYLLLLGLGVELVFALFIEKPWLEWASTLVSDTLIVVGVWGEIHFGRIARVAGDVAQADANARIAEATARASDANERAAVAEHKMEQERVERLKLQAKYAWRLLTGEQIGRIAEAASAFPHIPYDAGAAHDAEPLHLLDLIVHALGLAKWDMKNWGGPGGGAMATSRIGETISVSIIGVNVDVSYDPSEEDMFGPAARALAEALTAEGIPTAVRTNTVTRVGQMRIRVGSKPP